MSTYLRAKQRRAEQSQLHTGNLNLVPLVDILTSVVFFSLLTYQGAALATLTSYDLTLPPVVVTAEQALASAPEQNLTLLLAVRVQSGGLLVEHTGGGGFRQEIRGLDDAALDSLRAVMVGVRTQYPQNRDVLVVPDDDVLYDDVVRVLERLRLATFTGISLGNRARAMQVAATRP